MLNLVEIGKYIVKLRVEHNMSQQELADALYVTHQAVSKWENGKALPNIEILVSLTKLFNITIDQLIRCGIDEKDDITQLLNTYPREYILHQLLQGKLKFEIKDILYLLSNSEREMILNIKTN
ncbi:MAG TPA: helix-turn-helix transcriptional regulator [Bacilli bacterium]